MAPSVCVHARLLSSPTRVPLLDFFSMLSFFFPFFFQCQVLAVSVLDYPSRTFILPLLFAGVAIKKRSHLRPS